MKLGVGFIIFSGAEFLEPVLNNVRRFAHHVVGVYSLTSNVGTPAPAYLEPLLKDLQRHGLFDEIVHVPVPRTAVLENMRGNNRWKRMVGQSHCVAAGCTHYMTRDCDEFYDLAQFEATLGEHEKYDATVAPIIEYFHVPTRRAKELSKLYVPCVHHIDLKYAPHNPYGVLVDGERTSRPVKTFKVFKPEELLMHHMTVVRYDRTELLRKYDGHPHFIRQGALKQYLQWVDAFPDEQLETVHDAFGVQQYWDTKFKDIVKARTDEDVRLHTDGTAR